LRDSENGQTGETSWDGETGPRLVTVNGRLTVEYTAYEYSDYTSNALAGRLSLSVTGQISREDYQHRILAMHLAYIAIGAPTRELQGRWAVLSFIRVVRPDSALSLAESEAGAQLEGEVDFFVVYRHGTVSTPSSFRLRHVEILEMVELFIGADSLLINRDNKGWLSRSFD
jgi:hypothetical protein